MEEQKHEFLTTLNDKKLMVKKLEARLSAISSTMGSSDGGEPVSQTYFLIKAAQERETLQRDSDLLDLNVKNTAYKVSFQRADPKGKDSQSKKGLETKTRQIGNQLKRKEQALKNLEEDVAVVEQRLEISREEMGKYSDMCTSLEDQNKKVDAEVHEQSARLEKTSEAVRTAKVELRTKRGIGEGESTTEELEIDLQDVNHRNDVMLQQLGDFNGMLSDLSEALTHISLKLSIWMRD